MDEINIMIIGGRQCGKTSLLAAIKENMDEILYGSMLYCSIQASPIVHKLFAAGAILRYPLQHYPANRIFQLDTRCPLEYHAYSFHLGVLGRRNKLTFNFHEVPVSWFAEGLHEKEIRSLVGQSQVILIAIDSVYLMENIDDTLGYGVCHNEYNYAPHITLYFQEYFNAKILDNRLILFAPLKCEKYFNQDGLPEYGNIPYKANLLSAVKAGYQDLFAFLACDALKGVFTVAITPILTAEGIEFYDFTKDIAGELVPRFTVSSLKNR